MKLEKEEALQRVMQDARVRSQYFTPQYSLVLFEHPTTREHVVGIALNDYAQDADDFYFTQHPFLVRRLERYLRDNSNAAYVRMYNDDALQIAQRYPIKNNTLAGLYTAYDDDYRFSDMLKIAAHIRPDAQSALQSFVNDSIANKQEPPYAITLERFPASSSNESTIIYLNRVPYTNTFADDSGEYSIVWEADESGIQSEASDDDDDDKQQALHEDEILVVPSASSSSNAVQSSPSSYDYNVIVDSITSANDRLADFVDEYDALTVPSTYTHHFVAQVTQDGFVFPVWYQLDSSSYEFTPGSALTEEEFDASRVHRIIFSTEDKSSLLRMTENPWFDWFCVLLVRTDPDGRVWEMNNARTSTEACCSSYPDDTALTWKVKRHAVLQLASQLGICTIKTTSDPHYKLADAAQSVNALRDVVDALPQDAFNTWPMSLRTTAAKIDREDATLQAYYSLNHRAMQVSPLGEFYMMHGNLEFNPDVTTMYNNRRVLVDVDALTAAREQAMNDVTISDLLAKVLKLRAYYHDTPFSSSSGMLSEQVAESISKLQSPFHSMPLFFDNPNVLRLFIVNALTAFAEYLELHCRDPDTCTILEAGRKPSGCIYTWWQTHPLLADAISPCVNVCYTRLNIPAFPDTITFYYHTC